MQYRQHLRSYARLMPTCFCLMKPEALGHLTRSANDFAFILFMVWLRRILIMISLIGVATDPHRIRASPKGACLKASAT
jgi:hypothetical protein